VSWLTDGDSQATVLLFQVAGKKKLMLFPSPPFSPLLLLRFLSLLFRLDMAFQNPNASGVSVVFSLTLTVPFPLLLTVPLGMFSQFSFPSFLVCSLLSFLRFLPFSFLFSLFPPFRVLALGGIYRAKGSGGVPIATLWQRMGSRAGCPATALGWLGSGRGWQGATPLVYHHESVWGFGRWQACGV